LSTYSKSKSVNYVTFFFICVRVHAPDGSPLGFNT
jgi:hypothetical protein